MLLVNGVFLNPSDKTNADMQHYRDLYLRIISEIDKKYKYPIILKFPEKFKVINELSPSKPLWPTHQIWFKDKLPTNVGSDEWQYYEHTNRNSQTQEMEFMPRGYRFGRQGMRIESTQKDLAFFMLYVCSRCENSMNEDVINNGRADKCFVVENPKEEAFARIERMRYETNARQLIISDALEGEIRQVAKFYNISKATMVDTLDPKSSKYHVDSNGFLAQEHDSGVPYVISDPEVRDFLMQTIEKIAKGNVGIWKDIFEQLRQEKENPAVDNKKLFDELITNNLISLEDHKAKNPKWDCKVWMWTEPEKGILHKCTVKDISREDCVTSILKRMDTQTPFRVSIQEELKKLQTA